MVKLHGYKSPMLAFSNSKIIIYCPIYLTKQIGLRNYTRDYLYNFKNFLNAIK